MCYISRGNTIWLMKCYLLEYMHSIFLRIMMNYNEVHDVILYIYTSSLFKSTNIKYYVHLVVSTRKLTCYPYIRHMWNICFVQNKFLWLILQALHGIYKHILCLTRDIMDLRTNIFYSHKR